MSGNDEVQRKRKKSATILFIFLDIVLLIMSLTFFQKGNDVGGLVAIALVLFSLLILSIMRRTRVNSSNWKA